MHSVSLKLFVILGIAVAIGLATAISPFASASPDGLERVADDKGFLEEGRLAALQEDSPIPDYAFPGIENERVATGVAGFTGVLMVFAIAYGVAFALRRRRRNAGHGGGGARAPASAQR